MLNPNTFLRHGRYRIIRPIGKGGMGAVYEAEDLSLKTKVAVKEALVYEAALRDAFEKEAQRLARLRHPALPNVIDHFTEQGGQYLVMEFIEGEDLAEMLGQRAQPFPVAQVIKWAERLLDALDYLHQKKVIHRDIKPANIKLTPEGELILLDFGLAKGGLTRHTLSGMSLKGYTPGYAPPEQATGQATDQRSDLYSLAATLYALLTKQAPQEPSVRSQVMAHHVPDPLRPANELNPHVSPQLAHTLARALELAPDKRFATAAEMRSELVFPPTVPVIANSKGIKAQRAPSQKSSPQPKVTKPPHALPTWAIAAGGIIVLLLGIFLGSMLINRDPGSAAIPEPTPIVTADSPEAAVVPDEEPTEAPIPTSEPTVTLIPPSPIPPSPTNSPIPPSPIPTLGIGSTIISEKDQMTLLYVPEGDFEMGSADDDSDAFDDEKPRHMVYLDAYWIDQTEVTNAMFERFVEETGHQTEAEQEGWGWVCADGSCDQTDGADWQHPQGAESDLTALEAHPVVQVSWNDATAYCEWAGRRLPTEAEWEKAAGGTDSRKWPWGNETPNGDLLNFCDENCSFDHKDSSTNDGYEFTSPVGNYPAGASPYGVFDMAGNVWEWVNDSWDSSYYASSPKENPPGPTSQRTKVLRGGSWLYTVRIARVRVRDRSLAGNRVDYWGFCCARSPN